jgi:hypothetical protein
LAQELEELISLTNAANREMEDESRLTRDYASLAALWESFKTPEATAAPDTQDEELSTALGGVAGTGGHVVKPDNHR